MANAAVSEAFTMTNRVKAGCSLAPILFNLMFFAILMDAYRGDRPGIHLANRIDGHLFNGSTIYDISLRSVLRRQLYAQHHVRRGHAVKDEPLRRRVHQLRTDHQH
nr:unnamed protein product [Spirometra erinaceieuropaei]